MNNKRTFILACVALLSTSAAYAQDSVNLGGDGRKTETSPIIRSGPTVNGVELRTDEWTLIEAESWGKTWQDAEAEENRLRAGKSTLPNHSARVRSHPNSGTLDARYKDDRQVITGLSRAFVLKMAFDNAGDMCVGTVDPREILLGYLVGYYPFEKLLPNGQIKRKVIRVWKIAACLLCNNHTEGMVWTEEITIFTPAIITERQSTTITLPGEDIYVPGKPQVCATPSNTYVYVSPAQGPGQMISSPTQRSESLLYMTFYIRTGGRTVRTCKPCPPKPPVDCGTDGKPTLPGPTGGGGTDSGPNRDPNRNTGHSGN